jgi:YVTN family beta-propeller protein
VSQAFRPYIHPILQIRILYPSGWGVIERRPGFSIYVPHNNSVCYPSAVFTTLGMIKSPGGFQQFVSEQTNDLKQKGFMIIDSKTTTIDGNIAHSIISIVNGQNHRRLFGYNCATDRLIDRKIMDVYSIIANEAFIFQFDAALPDYSHYLDVIKNIYQSINFKLTTSINNKFWPVGIRMSVPPSDIVVDPLTDKLYVSADKVYVIEAYTGVGVGNITTGGYLDHLAINQITNTIYASSSEDGKVYVIDGYTNKLKSYFGSSHNIGSIAVDPNAGSIGSLIFVTNEINGTVSVIDGTTLEVKGNVAVGELPSSIAVDTITKRVYIANTRSNSVSVLDYVIYDNRTAKFEKIENIPVGLFPTSIVVDSNTGRVYVANSGINTVSVIDYDNRTGKFEKIEDIPVDLFPTLLSINPENAHTTLTLLELCPLKCSVCIVSRLI